MKNRIALKITLIYFTLGLLWILFSDDLAVRLTNSAEALDKIQNYKGAFFILVTSILLFLLVRNEILKKNKIEAELIKAKNKAEEADLLKSAFISNMSHEIRTPLNGILGFCELILDDSFTTEEKKVFAQNLTKNGGDLLKLINDIMDISKIQENQFEITTKRFNLNNLLDLLYYEYQQSDLKELRENVSFKLINDEKSPIVDMISDSVRLTHIFRNLLNNAFFFTPEGFIHFGFEETETGIELFVEDSGCGIEESSKDHIFKPFFKGKNMVVGNKGFGLGLAISKGLVRLLGSDLKFKTQVNVGTRFYFDFDKKDIIIKKPELKEI